MGLIDGIVDIAAVTAAKITRKYNEIDNKVHVTWAVNKLKEAKRDAVYAGQRAFRGYSDADIYELGYIELENLVKKLREFARRTHGNPADYDKPENWLKKRDKNWEDSIAPFKAQEVFNEYHDEDELVCDRDKSGNPIAYRIPTVKDCGVDYCAWLEDLDYAADVINEYNEYMNDCLAYCAVSDMFGKKEAERRQELLEAEFKRTWEWLGKWILNIWI